MIFAHEGGGTMTDPTWAWQCDLFEIECGKNIWCAQIMGLLYAGFELREFSERASKECFIARHQVQEVVARLNVHPWDHRIIAHRQSFKLPMTSRWQRSWRTSCLQTAMALVHLHRYKCIPRDSN